MMYRNVVIDVFAYALPPERISSAAIEQRLAAVYDRLHLPAGRLELMTGIRERRFWPPGTAPSRGAVLAGREAMRRSSVAAREIGCLINCSVCRDFLEPATATVVHRELGLPDGALVFDISNACLGILTGMVVLAGMIETGRVRAGMLVAGENSRSLVESTIRTMLEDTGLTRRSIKPFFASLTIGSGAVAVVMCHRDLAPAGHRLIGEASLSATEYNHLCRGNADKGMSDSGRTLMSTDSEALMLAGVETAERTWREFSAETGLTGADWDCICTHQVGTAHKRLLFERLALDLSRDFSNLAEMGNVGSVSCPLAVAMAEEAGRLRPGNRLGMLGIGSGINCTMLGVEW
ncbi:MAG: 3-oxoacyl-ACP synthase III [Victivallales bacterium]|nr:3-oxoacyl-ACP synthase III [Victivallales bacterium]